MGLGLQHNQANRMIYRTIRTWTRAAGPPREKKKNAINPAAQRQNDERRGVVGRE